MNIPQNERLYNLLPAIYRRRDVEQGNPLRALLAVIEGELRRIEDDIGALYDNWFIETCDEWVVPYIGDLLGVPAPSDDQHLIVSQRARVVNTVAYRRRKGIASTLEQVIYDATGWQARVVELFQQVAISQHVQHLRPRQGATVDVRDGTALGRVASPLDSLSRRVDVRPIAGSSMRQSPTNISVFVWRLQSYPITTYAAPSTLGGGRYSCHPLGKDMPLFNRPQPPSDPSQMSAALDLPGAIDPQLFAADLAAYQERYHDVVPELRPLNSDYYGHERGLYIAGVSPLDVQSTDLQAWEHFDRDQLIMNKKRVAVDVRLGRIVFAVGAEPSIDVRVSYYRGFAADIGGGTYDRRASLVVPSASDWVAYVAHNAPAAQPAAAARSFASLHEAITSWAAQDHRGVIQILDSEAYDLADLAVIELSARQLVIQAADGAFPSLRIGPTLAVSGSTDEAALTLSGVRLDAMVNLAGQLCLELRHASLPGGISSPSSTPTLRVTVASSIVGPLRLPPTAAILTVHDSIIDGGAGPAIAGLDAPPDLVHHSPMEQPGPPTTLERATIFGSLRVAELVLASETIFEGVVVVDRPQTGAVRYCYLPPGSQTPPRYRCQPDLEIATRVAEATIPVTPLSQAQRDAIAAAIAEWLAPRFSGRTFGAPAYGQLATDCPAQIAAGAEDGSEMGAFYLLHQPKRTASLRAALDEYLPAGLDAGVFYLS